MKIFVKARAGAKAPSVKKIDGAHFVVAVLEPAQDGRANAAIARALAGHFDVPISRVRVIRGTTGKKKIFEIP
ncbi:MAG: DUF167 family protein [Patescibacteria group bacterium]